MSSSIENKLDHDVFKKTIDSIDKMADYVDLRVNESKNTVIVMKDGKIQEIRSGSDFGGSSKGSQEWFLGICIYNSAVQTK